MSKADPQLVFFRHVQIFPVELTMTKTLCVGNLKRETTVDDLRQLFAAYGTGV